MKCPSVSEQVMHAQHFAFELLSPVLTVSVRRLPYLVSMVELEQVLADRVFVACLYHWQVLQGLWPSWPCISPRQAAKRVQEAPVGATPVP